MLHQQCTRDRTWMCQSPDHGLVNSHISITFRGMDSLLEFVLKKDRGKNKGHPKDAVMFGWKQE
ncbi:hypothetical protein E2C01_048145 [Portunus trituberculatus]|uniref:Uncharacterized protein n=1 Tax=Portunus trituberculatus TaxID=210409 RepID=A0A5B7G9X6_PORTR|nr:hypothetical protein [Portunus trituberculatus]